MGEICIFFKGKGLSVVELLFKSILVGYPYGGLVEDFHWEDHGLWRFSRVSISHKI